MFARATGIGKTTMVLQYIKENLPRQETLYVVAEDLYFSTHTLVDLADEFARTGGKYLFIDEIHKYKGWSRELKLIYDYHSELRVFFTGSSVLDIEQGISDLSRRVLTYHMQGLSFREYLKLYHNIDIPVYSLDDILTQKISIPTGFLLFNISRIIYKKDITHSETTTLSSMSLKSSTLLLMLTYHSTQNFL